MASPESAPFDAERILRVLADHEVDYVLVGGLAVQTHGHARTTIDADVIPAPLIRMKLARGRPLDLSDVAALTDPSRGPR